MRILITGGCGYLGARIAEYLALKENEVFIVDKNIPEGRNDWKSLMTELIQGDICDNYLINKIKDLKIESIIHTVSLDHILSQSNDFKLVSEINVNSTFYLLNAFKDTELKNFIYFSTQQVYGKIPNEKISEDYPVSPVNIYGLTHLMSENIVNYFNQSTDINCLNIRLSNSYGIPIFKENNCWWLVINDFCKTAIEKEKIAIFSDGTPQRDFINIKDLCLGIDIILNKSEINTLTNIFNIGSGKTLTILELAFLVSKVFSMKFSKELPIYFSNGDQINNVDSKIKMERFIYSTNKIETLGFEPRYDLENGILEILNYLKDSNN